VVTVVTFLWYDPKGHYNRLYTYGPDHVNRMRSMLSRHLDLPHEVVCVTDQPEGLDEGVRTAPLDRDTIGSPRSRFPKLALWRPDAAEFFGGDRLFFLDLDTVIVRDITPIVDRAEDVVLWENSSFHRPGRSRYNGSVMLLTAGSRPEVWNEFDWDNPPTDPATCHEQGWVSYMIGPDCATWDANGKDGIYKARDMRAGSLPGRCRMVTFAGKQDPSERRTRRRFPWIGEHWQ
jgi:hypothetical protein